MQSIKRVLNRLMDLGVPNMRREIVDLYLIQVEDIVNSTPYSTSAESIHLCPGSFLGFRKSPEVLWMRELEDSNKVGKAMAKVLEKLKTWHLSNIAQRKNQIDAPTSKLLIVKESTNRTSYLPPAKGDIVVINTSNIIPNSFIHRAR